MKKTPLIVYIVYQNEESSCDNSWCDASSIEGVYTDKAYAEERAKQVWGGRVTDYEVKEKSNG